MVISVRGLTPAQPNPEKEGLSWTHKELVEYLNAKGLQVEMIADSLEGEPTAILIRPDWSASARVFLKPSARAAAEAAGPWGDQAFAWGHFLFVIGEFGSPSLVPEIRAALTLPANLAPAGQNKSRSREGISFKMNRNDEGKRSGVSVKVNRGKIAHDTERAGQAVKNFGRKIAPAAHDATTHTVKGTVTNVDMNDRKLTLTTADNQSLTVVLPSNARISRNDVNANVENLAAGDRVEVVYRDENGKHVADSVTVMPGS
jgi:hypothetical protein